MNNRLAIWFTKEEVLAALKQMSLLSSPGLNDFGAYFFQQYESLINDDVSSVVLNILHGASMNHCFNFTDIFLIPKKCNSQAITNYRPIRLCNVIDKLVSKVIINRLKLMMNEIISSPQSAFILGHLITNNITITHE